MQAELATHHLCFWSTFYQPSILPYDFMGMFSRFYTCELCKGQNHVWFMAVSLGLLQSTRYKQVSCKMLSDGRLFDCIPSAEKKQCYSQCISAVQAS